MRNMLSTHTATWHTSANLHSCVALLCTYTTTTATATARNLDSSHSYSSSSLHAGNENSALLQEIVRLNTQRDTEHDAHSIELESLRAELQSVRTAAAADADQRIATAAARERAAARSLALEQADTIRRLQKQLQAVSNSSSSSSSSSRRHSSALVADAQQLATVTLRSERTEAEAAYLRRELDAARAALINLRKVHELTTEKLVRRERELADIDAQLTNAMMHHGTPLVLTNGGSNSNGSSSGPRSNTALLASLAAQRRALGSPGGFSTSSVSTVNGHIVSQQHQQQQQLSPPLQSPPQLYMNAAPESEQPLLQQPMQQQQSQQQQQQQQQRQYRRASQTPHDARGPEERRVSSSNGVHSSNSNNNRSSTSSSSRTRAHVHGSGRAERFNDVGLLHANFVLRTQFQEQELQQYAHMLETVNRNGVTAAPLAASGDSTPRQH
jgi:hypothetical protein